MTEPHSPFYRCLVSIVAFTTVPLVLFVGVAALDFGLLSAIVTVLATALVVIGGIAAIWNCNCPAKEKRAKGMRWAALATVLGLGMVALAVNTEQMVLRMDAGKSEALRSGRRGMPYRPPMPAMPARAAGSNNGTKRGNRGNVPKNREDADGKETTPMEAVPADAPHAHYEEPKIPRAVADEINRLLKSSDTLFKSGKSDAAASKLVTALGIVDEKLPRNLPTRGNIASTLAKITFGGGDLEGAMDIVDAHIAKWEAISPNDPLKIAAFHTLAGTLLGNAEQFKQAVERFEKALALFEKKNGAVSDIAATKAKVAISYARMGKKETAKKTFKEAKALLKGAGPEADARLDGLAAVAKEYDLE